MRDRALENRLMGRLPAFAVFLACVALFGAAPIFAADCVDGDGDGFVVCVGCDLPIGKSCGECNDSNSAIHPGATEICDGQDNDCDGDVDLADSGFNDPDPVNNDDDDDDGEIDEGFGHCLFNEDGPGGECKTIGRSVCEWPVGPVPSPVIGFGSLTCVNPNNNVILYSVESLSNGDSCGDGDDNDCDGFVDLEDTGCQQAEICDGLDNDNDGLVDETFPLSDPGNVGGSCLVGVGECERIGIYACLPDGSDAVCPDPPGNPKKEGAPFGNSCDNGKDDDCDGDTDLDDSDCDGFGDPELCGNGIDDDGDGFTDEGFPTLGLPCSVGVGACTTFGVFVCAEDGAGTECDATAGVPGDENDDVSCNDFLDNDCDGATDAADDSCASSFADLGVTCSLPYTQARPGDDCTGKHIITFDGGDALELQADLLALGEDGSLLGIIEDVQMGDAAHLASRLDPLDYELSTKSNIRGDRHTVFAPIPILRVTGSKNGLEDVAYCGILPYLEVLEPKGETISLSQGDMLSVGAYLPLVDVDTLQLLLNGVDILFEVGIDPAVAFPTDGTLLCTTPGECVFQIMAGCGDGSMVDVEISNLRVEGIDTGFAPDARTGVALPGQVNTIGFDVSGLPAGGHIFYVSGMAMPLPEFLDVECMVDDLADAGTASAFGITIDSPTDQEVVASAPVTVEGTACGGNEIARLAVNGNAVDVTVPTSQICTTGDGMLSADECYVDFSEAIGETDLALAAAGTAPGGTFKRGSNRVIADGLDVLGYRAFNTDVVFGLGLVQAPGLPAALAATQTTVREAIVEAVETLESTTTVDPAFVVGLEESGAQDFFNELCSGAINQFTANVSSALSGKTFATIDFKPDCSCNLNNVPIVLEELSFTAYPEVLPDNPTCKIDMNTDRIDVTVNLPDVFVKIGAHDSCQDDDPIFGACLWRTVVDVTGVIRVEEIRFDYAITETQIETKVLSDEFEFTWDVLDHAGRPFILTPGTCTGGPDAGAECIADNFCEPAPGAGKCGGGPDKGNTCSSAADCAPGASGARCVGGTNNGRGCTVDGDCPDGGSCHANCAGVCTGVVRNNKDDSDCEEGTDTCFNIVQNADVGVECLLGDICEVFDLVGRAIIGGIAELFTWGDFEFKKFLAGAYGIGDFQFEEDFLEDLALSDPDPMELAQVQPDPTKIEESENTTFSLGAIDVEIEDGGLTVAFPADFFSQEDASDRDQTPGASLSPADTPTVAEVIAVGSEVTLMVADDVFGQTYASMKEARQLDAFCTDLDGKTVGDLLPAESDGGCDSLGTSGTLAGAGIQGICHAIRDTDCESLIDETVDASTINLTAIKQGTCHGFEDTECSTLPTGFYGIQLPADCDKIGQSAEDSEDPDFEAGRSVVISRGRCAGLQGAVCDSLTALSGDPDDTAIKQGACHGEQGTSCTTLTGRFAIGTCTAVQEPCSVLNFNLLARAQCVISKAQISITEGILTAAEKGACGATPTKNISSTDGLLLCAAEQLEPDLLIREDDPGDTEVATDLLLNQLDVSFALDRGADGYTGSPQDLLGCFSQEGNEAPDCLLIGVCLNLTLQTAMGINSAECTADEVGFTFRVIDVIPSELAIGLVCSAPTETEDQLVVGEGFNSVVIDTIREKAQAFTPVFCIEGLDLGGILDFSSDDAKPFGLKTTGATGSEFADYLGITVDLASPTP